MNFTKILDYGCRFVAGTIMLQTLFFKFSASPESVYIFSKLGVEPFGRIGSGIVELISVLFLAYNRAAWLGAVLAIGTMIGAILSHLTILGVEIQGDGGLLFALAVIALITSLISLWIRRKTIPIPFLQKFLSP